ncbi:MAG TPA: HRDC domain-containing protein [Rhodanobacteraceae bacterium]|nr:HRDC domain-containing protein [Rhodanobacteraceae bacterium]
MSAAWIDHADRLPQGPGRGVLGLDTEFMRRDTCFPKLALVQAARAGECWLLDPLAYDAGVDVRALVDGRLCVMHSAGEDMEALAPLLGGTSLSLFDTQIAAALCGMGPGLSYQKLVAGVLGVDIPKDETRSDWLQRPLTASQLEYAAQDVAHLEALHEKLSAELQRRGRSAWHAEDCARLAQRAQRDPAQIDLQPQRGFRSASDWPAEARARLKRVLLWRDETARTLDRPRPWILDDANVLSLSQQPPGSPQELFERAKGQRALRGPQRAELFAILGATATPGELAVLAPIPPAPRGEAKHAVDAMRAVVQSEALRLDIPAGLLCPRRLIEEFAVTSVWPEGLKGWRAGVLEAKLTPLLPG